MAKKISAEIMEATAVAAGPLSVSLPNLIVAFGRCFGGVWCFCHFMYAQ
jgi:hypothetical protein